MHPPQMDTARLTLVRQPFDDPDYLFELKHDGFRALAYVSDGRCELVSRRRNAYKSFGELRSHLAGLKVRNAVIDGELVCLAFRRPEHIQRTASQKRMSDFLCVRFAVSE
jgi:bifunctional non-homologous end joining protein LigD